MVFAGNQYNAACEPVFAQSLRCRITRGATTGNGKQPSIILISLSHLWRSAIGRAVGHTQDDLIVFNLHFEARQCIEDRWLFQIAGANVETSMVPGTNDALAAKYPFHERRAVMRAMRAYGMKVSTDTRQQDLCSVRRHLFHFAVRKFADPGNRYVFVVHKYDHIPLLFQVLITPESVTGSLQGNDRVTTCPTRVFPLDWLDGATFVQTISRR